jgi:hypothetical protein
VGWGEGEGAHVVWQEGGRKVGGWVLTGRGVPLLLTRCGPVHE